MRMTRMPTERKARDEQHRDRNGLRNVHGESRVLRQYEWQHHRKRRQHDQQEDPNAAR